MVDEPTFVEAEKLAVGYFWAKSCQSFALCAADCRAVNNALHKGAKPENLILAPAVLFMELPTEEGMHKALQIAEQHLRAMRANHLIPEKSKLPENSKPWWRFW